MPVRITWGNTVITSKEAAYAAVERWMRARPQHPVGPWEIFPDSTIDTHDGWIVLLDVRDPATGNRLCTNRSVDVHVLGEIDERDNGRRAAPVRWEPWPDFELGRLPISKASTLGWFHKGTGEYRPNPLYRRGPLASGYVVRNLMEQLIAARDIGWITETEIYQLAGDCEVFWNGTISDAVDVHTSPGGQRQRVRDIVMGLPSGPPYSLRVNGGAVELSLRVLRSWLGEPELTFTQRWRGALLAGAIGDALGAPIENLPMEVAYERFGPDGVTDLTGDAAITDDTQMTLFTLEGLIRAHVQLRTTGQVDVMRVLQHAYQRWLHTQKIAAGIEPDGWLITHDGLFRKRAPGLTCVSALQEFARTKQHSTIQHPVNHSKGCGGVMRVAPVALWPGDVFHTAVMGAALTHGHPSGYLSAGTFAVLMKELLHGKPLPDALDTAIAELVKHEGHEETLTALQQALALEGPPTVAKMESLGRGGVGETALSMAVYAALSTDNPNDAIVVAANHGGDSDSTASVCGNIVGALYGVDAIRQDWLDRVQFRDLIEQIAADALAEFGENPPAWGDRYPGA